jgi:xanthine permease
MSASHSPAAPVSIVYGLNDHIPWPKALVIALQHLLAMFVGTITPATIVAGALDLPFEDRAYLINMSLVASGVGTLLQVMSWRGFGSGLLSITGTSFAFITPIILAGKQGGLALVFGMSLAMAIVPLGLAPFLPRLQKAFSPVVAGTVVLLLGLLLIPTSMYGVQTPLANGNAPLNSLLATALVVGLVVFFNALQASWARISAALLALAGGLLFCTALGGIHTPPSGAWFALPDPLRYGLSFHWSFVIPFGFVYIITVIETLGDLTACSDLSGQPTSGPAYWSRIRGGVLADGVNCVFAALINCFPSTTFAQNNGVIQMTGVASRRCGYLCGALLIGFGLLPGLGRWIASIPPPVISGLTLVLFGLIATAGLRILMRATLGQRELLIIAISLGLGLGVELHPEVLKPLPSTLALILGSGISTGGMSALFLNLLLPHSAPISQTQSR